MIFPRSFSLVIGIFICFTTFAYGATLPPDEVEALKEIGKTLGKTDWNFSMGADPCSGEAGGWITTNLPEGSENTVTCNCSFVNNTVCHIIRIALKSQDLPGMLPSELVRLPHLQDIDLTRNYLNGTIPPEWGSMKLVNISLLGNRLTGPIPKEFGNMRTLATLTVEFNQLSGPIPKELGSLPLLEKLHLTSNNFTGELPETLAKLTTLKNLRIGDNHFIGQIPNFFQNWVNLETLVIQASGLDGPIPLGISLLTKLSDLRISDLNGSQATFPPLNNLTSLNTLILRSCNIIGPIPDYLGTMTNLTKYLDLSFNKLSGNIPSNFVSLSSVQKIYLTGNLLSGPVPSWMLGSRKNIDLSYNNFSESQSCQQGNTNLFRSSSKGNTSGIVSCLGSYHCERNLSSFHINCGGEEVRPDGNTVYEADQNLGAPSNFIQSPTNWGFSGTGNFLDNDNRDSYITSLSGLSMKNSELYVNARLSPISLTYYGFCLVNGIYNVNLHFAEIMFNDGKNYSSLGRRIFNIYIQGELVQKDFNIEDEAGGIGKAIIKNYTANVTDGTLEIRFYWAGKGTTGIPVRGVYGPLISAISVNNPDFVPPPEHKKRISGGVVVGIVVAVAIAFVIILLLVIVCRRGFLNRKGTLEQDLRGLDLQTGSFTLRQIKAATNNFDDANKIGEGGFGPVYKGLLSDGTVIAVKKLSSKSKQGNREFVNEIGMISALQHPHLVKLYGCCIEGNQLLLVYEYMENNSLARALFAKLDEEESTHMSTRIAGTYGYMAPEYAMRGHLTDKTDVYSFGIVALEIVSGRSNHSYRTKEYCLYLLDWALVLKEKGNLMELVDPKLGSACNKIEVAVMINVALLCANTSPAVRPAMSSVVSMLESRTVPIVPDPVASDEQMNLKGVMIELQKSLETNTSDVHIQSTSTDGPYTASSASVGDLYPLNWDSKILENR
ncbi:hypothetical protein Vadar_033893 [Vaccinium darrowii]|uniref:Uncharacterized protein n=1 Tax=Vaccinium darrowii TaxID=229202 RepID=A0ACB7XWY1_9ERIC|nr:hypothetical protein Vadar_033893 [Vaccinium darrowii]